MGTRNLIARLLTSDMPYKLIRGLLMGIERYAEIHCPSYKIKHLDVKRLNWNLALALRFLGQYQLHTTPRGAHRV